MTDLHLDHIEVSDAVTYLKTLPDESVNLCITSPPYFGLRDYGVDGQIGLEDTPAAYIARLIDVFREVRRVLRDDGNCYVNLGDSYVGYKGANYNRNGTRGTGELSAVPSAHEIGTPHTTGLPEKSLMLIPHRFAIAMQDDGWICREDIVWQKPNPMPESVRDRCTRSHEYIFHFTKQTRYWYDADAVREPHKEESLKRYEYGLKITRDENAIKGSLHDRLSAGLGNAERMGDFINVAGRNRRSVWTINPANFADAHFATFPEDIPEICIKAACPEGGVTLDPFMGAGTVALVAKRLNRRYVGCDLNAAYVEMAIERINSIPYTLFSLMEVTP